MKRFLLLVPVLLIAVLVVLWLIPSVREKKVFIANRFENLISITMEPTDWIKWDSSVREAWLKDSSACSFKKDSAHHTVTIVIPGKTIRVTQLDYLLYQFEELKNDHLQGLFRLSVIPYVGNGAIRSQHNSEIAYISQTRLLYKLFPVLEKNSFTDRTITGLQSYLGDIVRYYGFSMDIKPTADTLFITRKLTIPRTELFKKLPTLFEEMDRYAREQQCRPSGRNLYISSPSPDSVTLLAGIYIDKIIAGDYLFKFMQMPSGQAVLTGTFEGPFKNRKELYYSMERFIIDRQLLKAGVPFENYLSPLPISDSSIVKITLAFPLRS